MARYIKIGKIKMGPECGFRWHWTYFNRKLFRRIHKGIWIGPLLIWWNEE
jgi:hypothetical protein